MLRLGLEMNELHGSETNSSAQRGGSNFKILEDL